MFLLFLPLGQFWWNWHRTCIYGCPKCLWNFICIIHHGEVLWTISVSQLCAKCIIVPISMCNYVSAFLPLGQFWWNWHRTCIYGCPKCLWNFIRIIHHGEVLWTISVSQLCSKCIPVQKRILRTSRWFHRIFIKRNSPFEIYHAFNKYSQNKILNIEFVCDSWRIHAYEPKSQNSVCNSYSIHGQVFKGTNPLWIRFELQEMACIMLYGENHNVVLWLLPSALNINIIIRF
jgi:hypothetical protein